MWCVQSSSVRNSNLVKIFLVLVLLVLPVFIQSTYLRHLMIVAMLYAVLASNWDLSLGYGGVFNFAHTSFFAVGAYAGAILAKTFGISPWLGILAGTGVAVIMSIIASLLVLRVKGVYVCLVTFALGQVFLHIVMSQSEYTGGTNGIVMIPSIQIGTYSLSQNGRIGYYYLVFLLLIVSTCFLRMLVRSNFGLSLVALRDSEEYAISRGIPLARQRTLLFAASAIFTGATGAVYAFYLGVVSPDLFGFGYIVNALSMLLLGGVATIYGPIIGGFVLSFVLEFMMEIGAWRFLIIACLIVGVLRFYPEGMLAAIKAIFQRRLFGSLSNGKAEREKHAARVELVDL